MAGKVFIGGWVSESTKKRFKIACVAHDVHMGDVMDFLLQKWIEKPYIDNEIKELINGGKEQE